jgi:hypothetical protein
MAVSSVAAIPSHPLPAPFAWRALELTETAKVQQRLKARNQTLRQRGGEHCWRSCWQLRLQGDPRQAGDSQSNPISTGGKAASDELRNASGRRMDALFASCEKARCWRVRVACIVCVWAMCLCLQVTGCPSRDQGRPHLRRTHLGARRNASNGMVRTSRARHNEWLHLYY